WYYNAVPLAKFVYSKIEERFALAREKYFAEANAQGMDPESRRGEDALLRRKQALLAEAKSILNEHRNKVFETVLPLFDVIERRGSENTLGDGEELPEADQHVHDYLIKNVFLMMTETYKAWLPEFVTPDQLDSAE